MYGGKHYAAGDAVSKLTATDNGNVEFVAEWNINKYTVTLDYKAHS
jgi:hypothetical protein